MLMVHTCGLLETLKTELRFLQEAAVKFNGHGFCLLLAPVALRFLVISRNKRFHRMSSLD